MSDLSQYRGDGRRPKDASKAEWASHPESYRPADALVKAVNVALLLGRPLLLTGEPGTGKTELAYSVAWELGLDEPLRFDTRSSSESRLLFYSFDALGRFHAGQPELADPRRFLQFQALGLAILRTHGSDHVETPMNWKELPKLKKESTPKRSVVLVDEIDKAPRDFPNDLLAAIDQMYFSIPELAGETIAASTDRSLRPIVIVTSNSERALPDAFLRRCIYHHVDFPRPEMLRTIVTIRLPGVDDPKLVDDAVRLFQSLRSTGLRKIPATAEFLDWLRALDRLKAGHGNQLTRQLALETMGVLVKRNDDRDAAKRAIEDAFAGNGG